MELRIEEGSRRLLYLACWTLLLALGLGLFLALALDFTFLHGDPLEYWKDSIEWSRPFDRYHVPLFPLLIALMRGITFGLVEAHSQMMLITILSFASCLVGIYVLVGRGNKGILASSLFALWPWVGLVYVVYPIADLVAMGLFIWGWWFIKERRLLPAAILLGLSLIAHKVMWIFVPGLLLGYCLQTRDWRLLLSSGLSMLPLLLLWVFGSVYYSNPGWLLSSNLELEVQSPSYLPVLDGLLGPLLFGDLSGRIRGLTVVGIFSVACLLAFFGLKKRDWIIVGSILPILFLSVTLDEGVIWSVVRFGRLLVVPFMWLFGETILSFFERGLVTKGIGIGIALVLISSQFAFAYSMALSQ